MYKNLYGDKESDKQCEERVLTVSMKDFWTYAVHVRNDMNEDNERNNHALEVSTKCNPLRFY